MKKVQQLVLCILSLYFSPLLSEQTDHHHQELAREYYYLADQLLHAGKKIKARELYLKAVQFDDQNAKAHERLGELFFDQGEIDTALEYFNAALALDKNDFHAHFNLSQCYIKKELWASAADQLESTIAADPRHEKAFLNLGTAYEKLNQHEKAITAYKRAIELNPHLFEAWFNLGAAYRHLEKIEEALEPFKKAAALRPDDLQVMLDLANIHNMLNNNQESLTLYEKILEKNPGAISILYNFGFTLKKMGKLKEALDVYARVLEQKPDYAPAHFSRSSIYLALGDLEKGWQDYEWRWKAYDEESSKYGFPVWKGEDLRNKILYVIAEQGLGDTFQFIRYIPLLKQRYPGLRIVFETQEPLLTLLKHQSYFDLVISRNQRPTTCDYQIALLSIPFVLKTRVETIPANIPYITIPQTLIDQWREKISSDKNFKIGICWQGNAGYSTLALRRAVASKSVHLNYFAPLFELPNVSIYCLQFVHGLDQIANFAYKDKLIQFDSSFDNANGRFMDTAALMHNLDLIISVDTGTCHLAAAMNIPTWIILPYPSDWRWLLNRSDSPWYPSVKLFRQQESLAWEPAMSAIVQELTRICPSNNPIALQPIEPIKSPVHHDKPTAEQLLFFEKLSTIS